MIPDKKRFGFSRVLSAFTKIDLFLAKNAKVAFFLRALVWNHIVLEGNFIYGIAVTWFICAARTAMMLSFG